MTDTFELLKGRTLVAVEGAEQGSDRVVFRDDLGAEFTMYHRQDCCESVYVAEVIGDPQDLVGAYLARAEEVSSDGAKAPEYGESYTWTFYKLATAKGEVVIRWLGESNGYYSESVDFEMTRASDPDIMKHKLGGPQLPANLLGENEDEY